MIHQDPDAIAKLVEAERPDVICLQETKLQVIDLCVEDGWMKADPVMAAVVVPLCACVYESTHIDLLPT